MNEKVALTALGTAFFIAGVVIGRDHLLLCSSVFCAGALVCGYAERLNREKKQ